MVETDMNITVVCTTDCRSLVTLEFLPRSHQPIRFVVTSSRKFDWLMCHFSSDLQCMWYKCFLKVTGLQFAHELFMSC